jgi:hypothetical protein
MATDLEPDVVRDRLIGPEELDLTLTLTSLCRDHGELPVVELIDLPSLPKGASQESAEDWTIDWRGAPQTDRMEGWTSGLSACPLTGWSAPARELMVP